MIKRRYVVELRYSCSLSITSCLFHFPTREQALAFYRAVLDIDAPYVYLSVREVESYGQQRPNDEVIV